MRNVFLFIRRYFNLFAFLALQFLALSMVVRYNRFHEAAFMGVASEITGTFNSQFDKMDDYFNQGEENRRVHSMNDSLLNLLSLNFMKIDSGGQMVIDSTRYDTVSALRRYFWRPAEVVSNSVMRQKNYLQLNRGAKHGIRDNMAVISSDLKAVGVVVNVSENFSQVMSLLHIQSRVNAALKKSGNFGTVEWDAEDPTLVILKGIPRTIEVSVGDTVVTSRYSFNFPAGIQIGTVQEVLEEKSTNFYLLKIRTGANFFNLQQVFVVENLQREEQELLDETTREKIDQQNN